MAAVRLVYWALAVHDIVHPAGAPGGAPGALRLARGRLALSRGSPASGPRTHALLATLEEGDALPGHPLATLDEGDALIGNLGVMNLARGRPTLSHGPTSLLQPVFVEDTDAYAIVYHANYLKYVHRACQRHLAAGNDERNASPVQLLAIEELRFLRPATLGDEILIETTLLDEAEGCLVMEHRLLSAAELAPFASAISCSHPRLDATAGAGPAVPIAVPTAAPQLPEWVRVDALAGGAFAYTMDIWEDELSADGLSPVAVLRAFERARSASIGGPAVLKNLQSEQVKVVIGRIDRLRFNMSSGGLPAIRVGQPGLQVFSTWTVSKARIVFDQRLVCSGTDTVVAHGQVTCLTIDAESGKMVRAPSWLASSCDGTAAHRGDPSESPKSASRVAR